MTKDLTPAIDHSARAHSSVGGSSATDYLRELTSARLWYLLRYDPWSGKFYRQVHHKNGWRVTDGTQAGYLHPKNGYLRVSVDNYLYQGHRLAWFYMTNEWPEADVDHINGVRNDNRWDNLREATRGENLANMRVKRRGFKGVFQQTNGGRWGARVRKDGVVHNLGTYDTEQQAHEAYRRAAVAVHGEFARFE